MSYQYFDKMVLLRCTKCGKNRQVTDRFARFAKVNDVTFVCDVCKGVRPLLY